MTIAALQVVKTKFFAAKLSGKLLQGSDECVSLLLRAGASVTSVNDSGNLFLINAVQSVRNFYNSGHSGLS